MDVYTVITAVLSDVLAGSRHRVVCRASNAHFREKTSLVIAPDAYTVGAVLRLSISSERSLQAHVISHR
jgi:hypothetical protein